MTQEKLGSIVWHDLTVDDAERVQAFYSQVVGWVSQLASMGDYNDYNMGQINDGQSVAGVCHARGANAGLPAQWLMYVKVASAQTSAEQCEALGGKIVNGPTHMGEQTYYVLQDPAGAVFAIFS